MTGSMHRFPRLLLLLAGAIAWLLPAPPSALLAQAEEPIPVYRLQGDGAATPLAGRYVDSVGVVTGVALAGFYLQDPAGDGRRETSDGIYVYTRTRPAVQVGECVAVRGALIDEFYDKTELSRVKAIAPSSLCRSTAPAPVELPAFRYDDAPAARYEALEGMLVSLPRLEGVVHGPTKRFASGEAEIALAPLTVQPYLSDGRIFFDETLEVAQLLYVSGALGVPLPDLDHGVHVRITGPAGAPVQAIVDYNFGKYQLLLLPGSMVEAGEAAPNEPSVATPAGDQDFTLCSCNLLALGRGTEQHPDPADYDREVRRRAQVIAEGLAGCTIIGVQEAGQPADAAQLAELLTAEYDLPYTATALPGPQSSNVEFPLTNALLTRTDRVQVLAAQSRQACSPVDYDVVDAGACASGQYPLFDRPPLAVDLLVAGDWGAPFPLTVIVNHLKSKAGDESVNARRRTAQAQAVAVEVQQRLAVDANAAVAVIGDLNDYYGSEVVRTLQVTPDPDLVHLYDRLPPLQRYTYIYNGASQALDHMLVTPALAEQVGEVRPLRLSADYAARATPDAATILHASDHDPVLARIWPGGVAWIAGNVRYPGVDATLLDAAGVPLAVATSDARGDLRFWNVAPGSYHVLLSAPPYLSLAVNDVAITAVSGENRFATAAHHVASQTGAALAQWMASPLMRQ
ncbi:MAG TPA: hypothetical protein GX400_15740 [Chloroflexi bacterium]|nr:hypothetical protein [Chloroflexota bacterium]